MPSARSNVTAYQTKCLVAEDVLTGSKHQSRGGQFPAIAVRLVYSPALARLEETAVVEVDIVFGGYRDLRKAFAGHACVRSRRRSVQSSRTRARSSGSRGTLVSRIFGVILQGPGVGSRAVGLQHWVGGWRIGFLFGFPIAQRVQHRVQATGIADGFVLTTPLARRRRSRGTRSRADSAAALWASYESVVERTMCWARAKRAQP